jgi:prohibitin 1
MRSIQNQTWKFWLVGGGILLAWIMIGKCFAIINPGQRGIIVNFGKVQDKILDEGIHLISPIGTKIKRMDVRIQKTDVEGAARTKDLQRVNVTLALNWYADPTKVNKIYQQIGGETEIINRIITPVMNETFKAVAPARSIESILVQREEVKEEMAQKIKNRLSHYGIIITDVALINVISSEEFTKATEAKQIAEQEAEQAKYLALKATREAEAEINRAKGQAEAQKLLQKNLTPALLQKQAIEKWDGKFPTFMGNSSLPLVNLNYDLQSSNP